MGGVIENKKYCPICKGEKGTAIVDVCQASYAWIIEKIKRDHPDWVKKDGACPKCVEYYEKIPGDRKNP